MSLRVNYNIRNWPGCPVHISTQTRDVQMILHSISRYDGWTIWSNEIWWYSLFEARGWALSELSKRRHFPKERRLVLNWKCNFRSSIFLFHKKRWRWVTISHENFEFINFFSFSLVFNFLCPWPQNSDLISGIMPHF